MRSRHLLLAPLNKETWKDDPHLDADGKCIGFKIIS